MNVLHEWLMTRPGPQQATELYIRTMVLVEGEDPIGLVVGADFEDVPAPQWAELLSYLGILANAALWQLMPPAEERAIGQVPAGMEMVGAEANPNGSSLGE